MSKNRLAGLLMSKKFKNLPCVYCSGQQLATTADHVLARQFFIERDRDNLPKAPACARCNGEKSELEHYLTAVLPFGGLHATATENLEAQVPPRLAKNRKLHRELNEGLIKKTWPAADENVGAMAIPFQGEKLISLYGMIARGLLWHEWKAIVAPDEIVQPYSLSFAGEFLFKKLFQAKAVRRVSRDWGNGTVKYDGVQFADISIMYAWRIQIYGGVVLAEDRPGAHQQTTTSGGVLIGSKDLETLLQDL